MQEHLNPAAQDKFGSFLQLTRYTFVFPYRSRSIFICQCYNSSLYVQSSFSTPLVFSVIFGSFAEIQRPRYSATSMLKMMGQQHGKVVTLFLI